MGSLKESQCWSIKECIKASCYMLDYKVYNVDDHKHLLCPSTKLEGAHEMFSNNIMHINNNNVSTTVFSINIIFLYIAYTHACAFQHCYITSIWALPQCLHMPTINYYTPTFEKRMLSFTKSRSSVDEMSYKGSKSLIEVYWSFLGFLLKVGIFFKILTIIFKMERRHCPLYET